MGGAGRGRDYWFFSFSSIFGSEQSDFIAGHDNKVKEEGGGIKPGHDNNSEEKLQFRKMNGAPPLPKEKNNHDLDFFFGGPFPPWNDDDISPVIVLVVDGDLMKTSRDPTRDRSATNNFLA